MKTYTTQSVGIPAYQLIRATVKQPGAFKETKLRSKLAVLAYEIDGRQYTIVSVNYQDFDVCIGPDRFYYKIDRKTKKILGLF